MPDISKVLHCGMNTILSDDKDDSYIVVTDSGSVCVKKLSCEISDVKLVSASLDHVMGTDSEGKLYSGTLQITDDLEPKLCLKELPVTVPVTMVASGFEHTLILSNQGTVFTCGRGSRGQLGHGDLTVDVVTMPTKVTELSDCGVKVTMVRAGGWHSTAVTDSGDVYVWGWNESGQLGLPTGADQLDTVECPASSREITDTKADPVTCSTCKNSNKGPSGGTCTSASEYCSTCHKCVHRTETGTVDGKMEFIEKDCSSRSESPENDVGKMTSKIPKCRQAFSDVDQTSSTTVTQMMKTDWVPVKVKQNMEPVQVMMAPYALELPDEFIVTQVACGSRHTCLLLNEGVLLTCGYNQFGQLGHGDTGNRDYLQTVSCFVDRNETVVHVDAGMWNTAIVTSSRKSL